MKQLFKLFSTWNSCFFLDEMLWGNPQANANLKKLCPVERKLAYLVTANKEQHLFLEENYWNQFEKWCAENQGNIALFRKIWSDYRHKSQLLKQKIDKITSAKPQLLSSDELAAAIEKARHHINEITPFDQFGMMASPIYQEKLSNVISEDKIGQATMPPWSSTTLKEELAVVNTALEILKIEKKPLESAEISEKYKEQLTSLANQFGFIPVFLFNPSWDEEHYAVEISEKMKTSKQTLEKRKSELENFEENTRQKIESATRGINSHLPEIIQILCFTRNEAELCLSYGQWKLQPFYKEICKRLAISLPQLRHYTEAELRQAIVQEKADAALLNNRIASGVGLYSDAETQRLLTDQEFNELLQLTGGKATSSSQMLCVFPGKAKGKVRIVKNDESVKSFKQGEILVALWSCIDYLPAMKKAAAFITEGGGITSHAAVIARELQIPSVVGYKGATKLFKDGDEVEVDAEKLTAKKKL